MTLVPAGQVAKVTLFDEDYAAVRTPDGPIALTDKCAR